MPPRETGGDATGGELHLEEPSGGWARESVAGLAINLLQSDSLPRLFIDAERNVVWRNDAADALLADRSDVEIRGGQLVADDRGRHALLTEFLAQEGDGPRTLCLPCSDGDGHLVIQANNVGNGSGPHAVSLTIHLTGSRFEARYADLRAPFGLTNAEHQIVIQLVRGRTAEHIASDTGSSVGTVRTHIRNIYAKLDVSSREMLFYRLRPFRIL